MSAAAHPRTPRVVACTRAAQAQADALGVTGCFENKVEAAIVRGAIHGEPGIGNVTCVFLDGEGLVVDVQRVRSPSGQRKAWLPVAVRPLLHVNLKEET